MVAGVFTPSEHGSLYDLVTTRIVALPPQVFPRHTLPGRPHHCAPAHCPRPGAAALDGAVGAVKVAGQYSAAGTHSPTSIGGLTVRYATANSTGTSSLAFKSTISPRTRTTGNGVGFIRCDVSHGFSLKLRRTSGACGSRPPRPQSFHLPNMICSTASSQRALRLLPPEVSPNPSLLGWARHCAPAHC